ncbi:heat shock 70 kDa protein 12A-like [Ruditapes philippinarum]|uniref:heat shock 70 kDa protein 12A-like n=1 Tax=Ruditapes philippinarum TaxID=129788 RepID=UPI00295A8729|nr:heat shock 70 kDa protein 12A-like [Ruditapes philippinarum]
MSECDNLSGKLEIVEEMASVKSKITEKETKKLMVAAIDFGTTFSGWGFSFDNDYKSDPTKISCKHWNSGKNISMKAPTTVLIQPDGHTLEAFGYEAEDRYAELADEKEHRTYYYFERFKMMLFDTKKLTRNEELEDDKGKRLPAKRVFAMVIRYLKDDLLKETEKKLTVELKEEEIQWVLTVPAIWTPPAKQFMRECAIEAGIQSQNLMIALEPEAASLYCKYFTIPKPKDGKAESKVLSLFEPGARYMVVDAGGGTIDIIVHEVCTDGTLREIFQANGGNWGGTVVDKAFQDFLTGIVGKIVMKRFQDEHKDDFLDLQREFEVRKRSITPDLKSKVKLKIPVSLSNIYKDVNSKSVKEKIERDDELNGKVKFTADKILFDSSLFKNFFSFTTEHLTEHMKSILHEEATANTNTILMVGGFSESQMLFKAVKSSFVDKNILLPEDAGLSVLKGAVIYGHDRKDISVRISPYTYGFGIRGSYDPLKHPRERLHGQKRVRGSMFESLIRKGEETSPGMFTSGRCITPSFGGNTYSLKLFASQRADPLFVDEPDCFKVGELYVDCTDNEGNVGGTLVQITCGGTEFEVQVIHETTRNKTNATFNFLD